MDAEEARSVEEELREIIRENGLLWVAEQVDDVVREGKPEFKPPRGRQLEESGDLVPKEVSRSRGVLASEPYSGQERAALLVAALSRVIHDAAEVQEAAAAILIESETVESLEFVDELDLEESHDLYLDRETSVDQRETRERLLSVLTTLEARILRQDG